jgi:hypothetical protein
MPRSKVPAWQKVAGRKRRQARHRRKPEVRERTKASNRRYYLRNKDEIRKKARARPKLGPDPILYASLSSRFRIIGRNEVVPSDASIAVKNGMGVGRRAHEFVLEFRDHEGGWQFLRAAPDLSTFLGLGGPRFNPEVKGFVREELFRRYPAKYRTRSDIPRQREASERPPVNFREREIRIHLAERKRATPDITCLGCGYSGPMTPRSGGPMKASDFPEVSLRLGAEPNDLLPAVFCPSCSVMILARPGTDVSAPSGGSPGSYLCECGHSGPLGRDQSTREYLCSSCGLVASLPVFDVDIEPPTRRREDWESRSLKGVYRGANRWTKRARNPSRRDRNSR